MPLQDTTTQRNYVYLSIFGQKFCQRANNSFEGATERINKNGQSVFERYFTNLEGLLFDIQTKDSPYGKQWTFSFVDDSEIYKLQMNYTDGLAQRLLKTLPNVDLGQYLNLRVFKGKDGYAALVMSQDGQNLKSYYTKESPNGLPMAESKVINGTTQWDFTEPLAFLEDMVENHIKPRLPKLSQPASKPLLAAPSNNLLTLESDDSAIPF